MLTKRSSKASYTLKKQNIQQQQHLQQQKQNQQQQQRQKWNL